MRHDELLELHKSYRRVFGSVDGERVLADLKRRSSFDASTFSPDSGRTQFNEGRRTMTLHVLHMMDPENFNDKRKEQTNG